MKTCYLYIHGGPGLNSFAEKAILEPLFNNFNLPIYFWNEPSQFRPPVNAQHQNEVSFSDWLNSLAQYFKQLTQNYSAIHLIAHSFGAHGAVYLSKQHPQHCASLTFLAPGLNGYQAQKNIAQLALGDFEKQQNPLAAKIKTCLEQTQSYFDEPMNQAFQYALQDAELFNHYWSLRSSQARWLSYLNTPQSQIDINNLFSVIKTFNQQHLRESIQLNQSTKVMVYFGSDDPVISAQSEELILAKLYNQLTIFKLPNLRHFVHLENPNAWVNHYLDQLQNNLDFINQTNQPQQLQPWTQ